MNAGPRIIRGPLLPGLTVGQQNRLAILLSSRSGIGIARLWEVFSTADRHAVAALSLHASDESLETRAGALARATGVHATTAGLILGIAIGLRLGVQWGRSNAVHERARREAARREREEPPAPPFDPVAAKAEHDAAKKWCKGAGRAARKRGTL